MRHTVYILGSAQDAGLPQFASRAAPDMAARLDPLCERLGPSLAVLAEDGHCLLIDVSPDIKEQEKRLLKLPGFRGINAIALTHAHIGHYAGLVGVYVGGASHGSTSSPSRVHHSRILAASMPTV